MKKTFNDVAHMGTCEVCGKEAPVVVAASTLSSCSSAYCEECLNEGLEPYSDIVGIVWCVGWDDLAVWAKDKIERTLKKLARQKRMFWQTLKLQKRGSMKICVKWRRIGYE